MEVQAPSTKATDWLGDADDWGEEEWGGGEDSNGNPGTSTPSSTSTISTPSTPSPLGATGGFPISTQNLNIAQEVLKKFKKIECKTSPSQTPSLALLSLGPSDGNANSRREGREGASEGQRPSAQVHSLITFSTSPAPRLLLLISWCRWRQVMRVLWPWRTWPRWRRTFPASSTGPTSF